MPFSRGGKRPGGVLKPQGPDPLFDVPLIAPDLKKLPWVRRTYDAWTTFEFRALVKAWLAAIFAEHAWMYRWEIRERATQSRLSTFGLMKPTLEVRITSRTDGQVFEVSSDWTAEERDTEALVLEKLDRMLALILLLHETS